MTPTERLRALLDECGVKYEAPHAGFTIVRTDNAVCKFYETLEEPERGVFAVVTTDWLTPEQAIAATLGATDAKPTQAESSGTCHITDNGPWGYPYVCSACGASFDPDVNNGEFNHCPNCGRRIEQ